jgi:hypothetical protein
LISLVKGRGRKLRKMKQRNRKIRNKNWKKERGRNGLQKPVERRPAEMGCRSLSPAEMGFTTGLQKPCRSLLTEAYCGKREGEERGRREMENFFINF